MIVNVIFNIKMTKYIAIVTIFYSDFIYLSSGVFSDAKIGNVLHAIMEDEFPSYIKVAVSATIKRVVYAQSAVQLYFPLYILYLWEIQRHKVGITITLLLLWTDR